MIGIDQTQVDPRFLGRSDDVGRLARNLSEHGVEERIVDNGHAAFAQAVCQPRVRGQRRATQSP